MQLKIRKINVPFTESEYKRMAFSAVKRDRPKGQRVRELALSALSKEEKRTPP